MAARCRLLGLSLAVVPLLWAPGALAKPPSCSNATLKGTYLYSSNGVLDGKPYAESGREVYDGQGGSCSASGGRMGPAARSAPATA